MSWFNRKQNKQDSTVVGQQPVEATQAKNQRLLNLVSIEEFAEKVRKLHSNDIAQKKYMVDTIRDKHYSIVQDELSGLFIGVETRTPLEENVLYAFMVEAHYPYLYYFYHSKIGLTNEPISDLHMHNLVKGTVESCYQVIQVGSEKEPRYDIRPAFSKSIGNKNYDYQTWDIFSLVEEPQSRSKCLSLAYSKVCYEGKPQLDHISSGLQSVRLAARPLVDTEVLARLEALESFVFDFTGELPRAAVRAKQSEGHSDPTSDEPSYDVNYAHYLVKVKQLEAAANKLEN